MKLRRDIERTIRRYLEGVATEKERQLIERWYSAWDQENNYPILKETEESLLYESDLRNIQKRLSKRRYMTVVFWHSVAAAILIIGVVLIHFVSTTSYDRPPETTATALSENKIVNESAEIKRITLSDSTQVLLHPHSFIVISSEYNKQHRDISLSGEAFFNVAHDPDRPFVVFTHGVTTTVLGTSFNIRAPSDKEDIIVAVHTGRVVVAKKPVGAENSLTDHQTLILTPNQQGVFSHKTNEVTATLVHDPIVITTGKDLKKVFDDEPITDILRETATIYGVDIVFSDSLLSKCRITTAFSNEGLFERLNILSKAIGADYTLAGTQIIFCSDGCQSYD